MAETKKVAANLDLDAIAQEHESEKDRIEPYVATVQGKPVHFAPIDDLPWEEVEELNAAVRDQEIHRVFWVLIKDDDELNLFFEQEYKAPVIEELLKNYYKHNGWDYRRQQPMTRAQRRSKG